MRYVIIGVVVLSAGSASECRRREPQTAPRANTPVKDKVAPKRRAPIPKLTLTRDEARRTNKALGGCGTVGCFRREIDGLIVATEANIEKLRRSPRSPILFAERCHRDPKCLRPLLRLLETAKRPREVWLVAPWASKRSLSLTTRRLLAARHHVGVAVADASKRMDALAELDNIRQLQLVRHLHVSSPALLARHRKTVERLEFVCSELNPSLGRLFATFPRLRSFEFQIGWMSSETFAALLEAKSLRSLHVPHVTSRGVKAIAVALPKLVRLRLWYVSLSTEACHSLARLEKLQELELHDGDLFGVLGRKPDKPTCQTSLGELRALQTLAVPWLNTEGLRAVASLPKLRTLKITNGHNLEASDLEILRASKSLLSVEFDFFYAKKLRGPLKDLNRALAARK